MTRPIDAWEFWNKSQAALNELADLMQVFSTHIAQCDAIELPPHTVRNAKRALADFQENFCFLLREQKRKAGR